MKKIVLSLVFLCVGVLTMAQQEGSGPEMVFERTAHNFGNVQRKGGDLIAMFRFVNEGDTPLVIKKVHKSCSCTTADYSRRPVLPGERGEIKIKYEPHKVEPGIFHKVIQIYTNESKKVRLVTIQGNSIDEK